MAVETLNPDEKYCPRCGETIKSMAVICRYCKFSFEDESVNIGIGRSRQVDNSPYFVRQGNGVFFVKGDYENVFNIIRKAFTNCHVQIKETDKVNGYISGKKSHGFTPITIIVSVCSCEDGMRVLINVYLAGTFDMWGIGAERENEISGQLEKMFQQQLKAESSNKHNNKVLWPPSFDMAKRLSNVNLAHMASLLGALGLIIPLCGLGGIICAGIALSEMNQNNCSAGKGMAVFGLVFGIISTVLVFVILALFISTTR